MRNARWNNKSKYHNRKTNGFDSKKEADRAAELKMMERAGIIQDLKFQVKFTLSEAKREFTKEFYKKGPRKGQPKLGKVFENACVYVADFTYYQDGRYIVEDCKGFRTPEYIVKRKWMLEKYGVRIYET